MTKLTTREVVKVTTIVYRNGLIAYESRETSHDNIIVDDAAEKRFSHGECEFFTCGNSGDVEDFAQSFINWKIVRPGIDIEALVYDHKTNTLYRSAISEKDELWKVKLRLDHYYAIGSGRMFALGALSVGAMAEQALDAAIKCDVYSGGLMRIFQLPGYTDA